MSNDIIELKVEGMTCTNCARTVSRFLEKKGLKDVHVNVTTHEVSFDKNHSEITIDDIKKGIHKLGFVVVEEDNIEESKENWTLEKKLIVSIIFTAPLFFGHLLMMLGIHIPLLENHWTQFFLCIPVFMIGVFHFGKSAFNALKMKNTNMDVLIFIGSTAAFIYSIIGLYTNNHNYIFFETAATIITLVLLGNLMEKRAVQKTTKAIDELNHLKAENALKISSDGTVEKINLKQVRVGDVLLVNEGDSIPTDGVITKGDGYINEAMLTGESELVHKKIGHLITGASILSSGNLQMKVTAIGKDTVLNKIIDLVKNAQNEKTNIQRLADKISEIFVPAVVGIALLTFVLRYFIADVGVSEALMNAIAVLVISCPCAMGLATPAAIMVGVGRAAKEGILIKGSRTLEILAHAKNIVFDKTGTLTEGKFSIKNIDYFLNNQSEINAAIQSLEAHSSHPIAQSLYQEIASEKNIVFKNINEVKGLKIEGVDENNNTWEIGSYKIAKHLTHDHSHNIYVLKNNKLVATIDIEDSLKKNIKEVVEYFNHENIDSYLLSGDKKEHVEKVAQELKIKNYEAEKLPEEKHEKIKKLKEENITVMVGDGINDAAALAIADVGITFSSASDIAVQSSGVVLLNDKAETLKKSHQISKQTLKTIRQNLFWAFAYNIVAIPIAALGFLNPMWGALFMAFSDIVVIGNSLLLRTKKLN